MGRFEPKWPIVSGSYWVSTRGRDCAQVVGQDATRHTLAAQLSVTFLAALAISRIES